MDNANGATVTAVPDRLQALIAAGYAVDPDPNRLTYGIFSPTKLNERAGTNYYVTFSFTENPNRKDPNVYLNLVDKNTNKVVESVTVSDWTGQVAPNYTFKTLDALKNAGTVHSNYTFTPSISESGGFTQKMIAVYSVGDSNETVTMLYDLAHILKEGKTETGSQVIDSQYAHQSTFYIAKNPDASYTKLATWVNEGWSGQAYTISGERQFEGYELTSSPTDAQKSGILVANPPVGFKWIDSTVYTLKDGSKQYREGEIVDIAGSVVYRIYQHNQVAYTSQPLAPGEYATDAGPLRVTKNAPIGSRFEGDEGHAFKIQNNSKYASTDVAYYYVPQGTVTVHYVDTEGNIIADAVVDTEKTASGTEYSTTDHKPTSITTKDGKVYYLKPQDEVATSNLVGEKSIVDITDANKAYTSVVGETGTVEASTNKHVIYIYEQAGSVLVHYVNEAGHAIKKDVVDTDNQPANSSYDTAVDNKPNRILTDDGILYELVPEKTSGAQEQGKVVAGQTLEVTYVYKEVVAPAKGDVIVHYVDEAGNPVQGDVVDTKGADVDTPYDTTDNNMKPTTIVANGKTYELVPEKTQGNETGKVVAGTTEVTYVYKEVVAPAKGDVIVHYVDEAGNPVQGDVVDTKGADVDTPYDTTDNNMKPTTIVANGKTYELVPEKTQGNETGKVVAGTTEVTYVYTDLVTETITGGVTPSETDQPEPNEPAKTPVKDTTGSTDTTAVVNESEPTTKKADTSDKVVINVANKPVVQPEEKAKVAVNASKELPQTGETHADESALGLVALAAAGVLSFMGMGKKRED